MKGLAAGKCQNSIKHFVAIKDILVNGYLIKRQIQRLATSSTVNSSNSETKPLWLYFCFIPFSFKYFTKLMEFGVFLEF